MYSLLLARRSSCTRLIQTVIIRPEGIFKWPGKLSKTYLSTRCLTSTAPKNKLPERCLLPRILTSPPSDAELTEHNAKLFGSPKERLDFYRREIQYETSILANRTDAYLAAQSFLVIAFASCMANLNPEWGKLFTLVVPPFLALLGLLSSLNAWPGIRAAYDIIDHWYFKQSELLRSEPVMGMAYDESPLFCERESTHKGYRKALLFSVRTPWMFATFWVALGTWAIYIQLASGRVG